MGIGEVMKFVVEKLKETVSAMENFSTGLAMADNWIAASSEKIHHQIHHTSMPFLSAAVVLVVVVCVCGCCCCGGNARMMKAPGRNRRMPRQEFERNPKGYFRKLRSHSD